MTLIERSLAEPISQHQSRDFSKLRIGSRFISDPMINLGSYKEVNPKFGNKRFILEKLNKRDYKALRDISNYFYESSGIYYRLCRHLAFLYRYDWYISVYRESKNRTGDNKILSEFSKVLRYLDQSYIKKLCGDIALEVIKNGVYYGYLLDLDTKFAIQQLPAEFCRCRYFNAVNPIVELNMRFFDSYFPDAQYRIKVLQTFPKDIQKAYILFKEGRLAKDFPNDTNGWYVLDPELTVKLNLNNSDFPSLVGTIPSIIDLDEAQDLDRKKTMQQLLKILIQKLPIDKNGDLIFDMKEAEAIHENAVKMLQRSVGVDVLTTFADIIAVDTKDRNGSTTKDDLEKVERTVFNNSGSSHNLFNADGNLATNNSILNDEANIRDLILQFQMMFNKVIDKFSKKNSYTFEINFLETTQYNYKELSKIYKELAQYGSSNMLPQIALGHSQSSILATAQFENQVLHLSEIMIPPMSSNTMNPQKIQKSTNENIGRPEKDDNEKSDKTIQNRESMS